MTRKCEEPLANDICAKKHNVVQRRRRPNADKQQESLARWQRAKKNDERAKNYDREQRRSGQTMKSKDKTTACKDWWQQTEKRQQVKTDKTSTDNLITPYILSKKKSNLTSSDKDMPTWSTDKKDNEKGHQFVVWMQERWNQSLQFLKKDERRTQRIILACGTSRPIINDYGLPYYEGSWHRDTT